MPPTDDTKRVMDLARRAAGSTEPEEARTSGFNACRIMIREDLVVVRRADAERLAEYDRLAGGAPTPGPTEPAIGIADPAQEIGSMLGRVAQRYVSNAVRDAMRRGRK